MLTCVCFRGESAACCVRSVHHGLGNHHGNDAVDATPLTKLPPRAGKVGVR
jgi:hypothetical protein